VWLVYVCCLQSLLLGSARHFWGGGRLEIASFLFSSFLEVSVGVCMAISSRCKCDTVCCDTWEESWACTHDSRVLGVPRRLSVGNTEY